MSARPRHDHHTTPSRSPARLLAAVLAAAAIAGTGLAVAASHAHPATHSILRQQAAHDPTGNTGGDPGS